MRPHDRLLKGQRLASGESHLGSGSVRELEEGLWVIAVCGVAGLQRLCRCGFTVRMRGRRVRALAGAAAGLCAGAGLLHLPSLSQGGLVNILEAKSLSLVFVEGVEGCFHTGVHSGS